MAKSKQSTVNVQQMELSNSSKLLNRLLRKRRYDRKSRPEPAGEVSFSCLFETARQQSIAISQANFKINRTSIDANSLHQAALKHLIANRVHLNSWSCIFYSRRKYIGFCVWFQFNFKCLQIKFVKKENFYVLEN